MSLVWYFVIGYAICIVAVFFFTEEIVDFLINIRGKVRKAFGKH